MSMKIEIMEKNENSPDGMKNPLNNKEISERFDVNFNDPTE